MRPDVTVVAATRNSGPTVRRTICSALEQTAVSVAVDDQSTDGTAELLGGWADHLLRSITLTDRGGPPLRAIEGSRRHAASGISSGIHARPADVRFAVGQVLRRVRETAGEQVAPDDLSWLRAVA